MGFNETVLICDEVDPVLNKVLQENGLKVSYEPQITPDQIKEKISNYNIIIVRSRTKITKELIDNATKCKIIARVGVGLD
ncbi:MAG: 3-phosphoglycerate dehydrogenase, partial [Thermoproteota archaeon]